MVNVTKLRTTLFATTVGLAAWTPLSLMGQQAATAEDTTVAVAAQEARGIGHRAELEAFLDGLMLAQMSDKNVAGAIVSVVKDGEVFFAKGYGYADVANGTPVDPETTLFRIGSISKLFTWTAVMQLVEQGRIDLDADVNTYLDFEIPATYDEPITMWHFLTHTPGLEEDGRDLFTTDPDHMAPMGEWLPAHMPSRVRLPGTFSSYSNWGTATAGYIVERVSGMSYDDYLEEHLFEPLAMAYTTARQPLPERFAEHMSKGYGWEGGAFVEKDWEIVTGAAPAGSMSASAVDMAYWMLAHLEGGRLGEAQILSPETAQAMYSRQFSHDDRIPGWGLGFYEKSSHGLRMIGHGGDTQWFHSDLTLIPSENVGFFVSYNTGSGGQLSFLPFRKAFLDHYYPFEGIAAAEVEDLDRFAGSYLFNRTSYTTFQKALNLTGNLPIQVVGDSALAIGTPFGEMRLKPIDDLLFGDANGEPTVAFRTDERGGVTHAFLSFAPMMALEKQSALASPPLHQFLLGAGFVVFALIVVGGVLRWSRARREERPGEPGGALGTGRRMAGWGAFANVLFLAGVVFAASDPQSLMSDSPWRLYIALLFPVLGVLLMLGGAWFTLQAWRQSGGTFWERLRLTVSVTAGLVFAWSLHTFNLLGWRF
ncbi:MAG: beta-lactamase family protein [Gemmatimonadetes bacterium]|nr:beta-lactamase family protein [Gemmatimonadota bacterium]